MIVDRSCGVNSGINLMIVSVNVFSIAAPGMWERTGSHHTNGQSAALIGDNDAQFDILPHTNGTPKMILCLRGKRIVQHHS